MLSILAQTGTDMISAEVVIGIIGAVGIAWARISGVKEGKKQQGSVTIEDQPVRVRKEDRLPTWAEVSALSQRVSRLEDHLDLIRNEQTAQFKELLEAGHQRELRLRDTLSQALASMGAKFSGDIRAIHERIESCQSNHSKKA